MVFSNINGVALSDPCFWPLYEQVNRRKGVIYIHPTSPVGVEAMTDYWLTPLLGFTFDTTLAAAKLVFSGVIEKFPEITWVLAKSVSTHPPATWMISVLLPACPKTLRDVQILDISNHAPAPKGIVTTANSAQFSNQTAKRLWAVFTGLWH